MAEFQEVMRQLGRICASNFGECDICDFCPYCPSKTFLDKYEKSRRVEQLEKMVLKWAEEHPEPVYPSWYEYLTNMYPATWNMIKDKPIPADIAQKLGIEPKER